MGKTIPAKELGVCECTRVRRGSPPRVWVSFSTSLSVSASRSLRGTPPSSQPGHPEQWQPQQQARPQTKRRARRGRLAQPGGGAGERALRAPGPGRGGCSADPARAAAPRPEDPAPGRRPRPGWLRAGLRTSTQSLTLRPPPPRPSRRPHNCNRCPGRRRSFSGRPAESAARRGRRHGCVVEELAGQRRG